MKISDTPITFTPPPPPRSAPAIPRARRIKRVALVAVPYHSGVVESAGTWLNVATTGLLRLSKGIDPRLEAHVTTRDYRKYKHAQPVVKPPAEPRNFAPIP